MSTKISALVWEHAHYTGTRKLVLLALADAANQEGLCWPAMQTIARMAECSVRRAREHVAALCDDDWLERQEHPGHSNWYLVHLPEKVQQQIGLLPPSPDLDSETSEDGEISPGSATEGGEISPGSTQSTENVTEGGEISPGGAAKSRRGGGEISPGGRRNLAGRTVREPEKNLKRTEEASSTQKKCEGNESNAAPALTPGDMEPTRLWGRVIATLQATTPAAQMASWIYPARIARYGWDADDTLRVELAAPGSAHARMIEDRFGYLISDAVARVYNLPASRVALSIVCAAQVARG